MKSKFLRLSVLFAIGAFTVNAWAQTWTAPVVPGEDLSSLESTTTVYMYNVGADAFTTYGMDWGTQAIATRLKNGDTEATTMHGCTVTVNGSTVRVILKDKSDKNVSGNTKNAEDVWSDSGTETYYSYQSSSVSLGAYTLKISDTPLDVSYPYGGPLTFVNGQGFTDWAFISETSVTNGSYALYKAKKKMYALYEACSDEGKVAHAEDFTTALSAYTSADATAATVNDASKVLFNAVFASLEKPVDVSFLFDDADMVGAQNIAEWTTNSATIAYADIEIYRAPFVLEQSQTVPDGMYSVVFHALFRQDGNEAAPNLVLSNGENTASAAVPMMEKGNFGDIKGYGGDWDPWKNQIPNNTNGCGQAFTLGNAIAKVSNFSVIGDKLKISVNQTNSLQWFNWQGFEIVYEGGFYNVYKKTAEQAEALLSRTLPTAVKTAISDNASLTSVATTEELSAATAILTPIIESIDAIETEYLAINSLLAVCNGYTDNSTPNAEDDLTTFNLAITEATTSKEKAKTADELNTIYNNLEEARRVYIVKAVPTNETSFDFTFKINNPLFDDKDTGWSFTGSSGNRQYGQKTMEAWNNNAMTVSQVVKELPNGFYMIGVDVISGSGVPLNAYAFAVGGSSGNSQSVTAVASANNYTTMSAEVAGKTLSCGAYVSDGILTLGIKDPSTGNGWFVADNFELHYMGISLTELENIMKNGIIPEAENVAQSNDVNAINKTNLAEKVAAAEAELENESRTIQSLETAVTAIRTAIDRANGTVQNYGKIQELLNQCEVHVENSTPNTETDLTTFEVAISTAEKDKETAIDADALDKVYNALHTAFRTYIMHAAPTEGFRFDMNFLVDGIGNSTNGWVKAYSEEFTKNYQYQNSDNKDTETLKKKGYLESWNDGVVFTGTLTYTKTGLSNGHYTIAAYAFTDGTTSFKANEASVTVDSTGKYVKPIVEDVLVDDGTLTFGLENETGTWIGITNIHDFYMIGGLTDDEKRVAAKKALKKTIDSEESLNTTKNVGDGVFEIPESAVEVLKTAFTTANGVYSNESATTADLERTNTDLLAAIDAYKNVELNGPSVDERFYITIVTPGHGRLNCPVIAALGSVGTNNPTGYTFYAAGNFENYRPTVFTFTKVNGNLYNISVELETGTVYLTYGSLNGSPAGWNKSQIQGTTNVNAKGTFKIEASSVVDGGIRIVNTETGKYLDCENNADKNYPIYSGSHDTYEFALVDASEVTTSIVIDAEVQLATCVLLFDAELPANLKAYTTETLENGYLNLVEVNKLEAYKPYILYAENGYEGKLSGKVDLAGYQLKVTDDNGLLAGAVETQVITYGYALQNQTGENGKGVAFYSVDTENSQKVTIPAGKCWLDVQKNSTPAATTRSISLRFPEGGATGIGDVKIELPADGSAPIYTIDGKRVDVMQSGQIYIIGGKKMIKK